MLQAKRLCRGLLQSTEFSRLPLPPPSFLRRWRRTCGQALSPSSRRDASAVLWARLCSSGSCCRLAKFLNVHCGLSLALLKICFALCSLLFIEGHKSQREFIFGKSPQGYVKKFLPFGFTFGGD